MMLMPSFMLLLPYKIIDDDAAAATPADARPASFRRHRPPTVAPHATAARMPRRLLLIFIFRHRRHHAAICACLMSLSQTMTRSRRCRRRALEAATPRRLVALCRCRTMSLHTPSPPDILMAIRRAFFFFFFFTPRVYDADARYDDTFAAYVVTHAVAAAPLRVICPFDSATSYAQ